MDKGKRKYFWRLTINCLTLTVKRYNEGVQRGGGLWKKKWKAVHRFFGQFKISNMVLHLNSQSSSSWSCHALPRHAMPYHSSYKCALYSYVSQYNCIHVSFIWLTHTHPYCVCVCVLWELNSNCLHSKPPCIYSVILFARELSAPIHRIKSEMMTRGNERANGKHLCKFTFDFHQNS